MYLSNVGEISRGGKILFYGYCEIVYLCVGTYMLMMIKRCFAAIKWCIMSYTDSLNTLRTFTFD